MSFINPIQELLTRTVKHLKQKRCVKCDVATYTERSHSDIEITDNSIS